MSMLSLTFDEKVPDQLLLDCFGQQRREVAGLESPYPAVHARIDQAIPPIRASHRLLATASHLKGSCLWGGRGKTTEYELNSLGTEGE